MRIPGISGKGAVAALVLAALAGAALYFAVPRRGAAGPVPPPPPPPTAGPSARGDFKSPRKAGVAQEPGKPAERRADPPEREWNLEEEKTRLDAIKARALPKGGRPPDGPEKELPPADAAIVEAIDKAYDADDLKATLALAEKARSSKEPEVRSAMVWALDWFGEKALPEIISFLGDPDAGVAKEAFDAWESAISELDDDDGRKLYMIEYVMKSDVPAEVLESAAMEYEGMDDRAAVESLVRVITGGGGSEGARIARECYESVTGDEYTTPEDARKWIEEFAAD